MTLAVFIVLLLVGVAALLVARALTSAFGLIGALILVAIVAWMVWG
jgi:hypothetical protein